jgi:hypothetical protein
MNNTRIHAIHKHINELESMLRELRAEVALLHAEQSNEVLAELESFAFEEDG